MSWWGVYGLAQIRPRAVLRPASVRWTCNCRTNIGDNSPLLGVPESIMDITIDIELDQSPTTVEGIAFQ